MIDHDKNDDAPELHNSEQEDEDEQAQTVAQDALDRKTAVLGQDESESGDSPNPDAIVPEDASDLIEKMKQMESSGQIDYDAYRGERNDDDEAGNLDRRENENRDARLSDEK